VLAEWLAHRREVLLRRSRHRLAEIERRLEVLGGYLIAYLNIDEVIRIIREEDEPKPVMMARWDLTDLQAESILNMRLRALRKLEEFEIRKEFDALSAEKAGIEALLSSEAKQWKTIRWEVEKVRDKFSTATELGRRRTGFDAAPERDLGEIHQAMIEKEPVTVVVSEKGWLRAMKGHLADFSTLTFKEGDALKLAFHAQTTDKILVFTTGGKFYTLGADKLPGGRGHGEPIRIMVDMENDQAIVTAFAHDPARKLLLASHAGNGFVVPEAEVVANTRKGKQVMNVKTPDEATHLRAGRRATTSPSSAPTASFSSSRCRNPRNDPRQGRPPPALQGWRRRRHQDLCHGSRPDLAGFLRPDVYALTRRTDGVAGRARRGRAPGAEGVSADGEVIPLARSVRSPRWRSRPARGRRDSGRGRS
jgi:DNA gyrase/topoisomerase IV subunit A